VPTSVLALGWSEGLASFADGESHFQLPTEFAIYSNSIGARQAFVFSYFIPAIRL
jgi:hypothetical protein